jgi:integrase/recombinase XerD
MSPMELLIATYLDHLTVERGVSRHTSSAYRRDLRRYAAFLADRGVSTAEQVTPLVVAEYAASLAEGVRRSPAPRSDPDAEPLRQAGAQDEWRWPPLASASIARAVVAVRSLHRFAVEEGIAREDPAHEVQPPRPARRLPKALSIDQVQAMLDVPARDTELGLRDRALLELLYGTGARVSEATDLDVDDVSRLLASDVATPGLRVLGKGNKERIVPLGSYARAALTDYLVRSRPTLAGRGRGTPALFLNARGGRLSRQSAWSILQSTAERAGVPVEVSPHTLRHSFATHLLDGGADVRVVQELLGHASVTTTQIYTLVTVDHLREVYLTSHPRAY